MARKASNRPFELRARLSEHWIAFLGKPQNGSKSLIEIQHTLNEMSANRRLVQRAASMMKSDVEQAREIIDKGNASIRDHN